MSTDLSRYRMAVEKELRDILTNTDQQVAPLYQMMQYHMGWLDEGFAPADADGGKRLRPVLCLLACEAVCGDWSLALPAAAAIELTHNFSLLHDDIEDEGRTRRHRATAWTLWGVPQALNTGDTMWTIARLAVYRLLALGHQESRVLWVGKRLEETCLALCTGQYLDIHFESEISATRDQYMQMISGKTAALISASVAIGAHLGGGDTALVADYAAFGRALGLAFQIVDDILGIWGDPSVTGKSAASDILTKKKTLPILFALEQDSIVEGQPLSALFAQSEISARDVPKAIALLERYGARRFAQERAAEYHDLALGHLAATGIRGPAQDTLRGLAESAAARTH